MELGGVKELLCVEGVGGCGLQSRLLWISLSLLIFCAYDCGWLGGLGIVMGVVVAEGCVV